MAQWAKRWQGRRRGGQLKLDHEAAEHANHCVRRLEVDRFKAETERLFAGQRCFSIKSHCGAGRQRGLQAARLTLPPAAAAEPEAAQEAMEPAARDRRAARQKPSHNTGTSARPGAFLCLNRPA
jgi:hypothetical protein